MKAILKRYNIVEKLLLLCFLTLVSKPIVGQLLYNDTPYASLKWNNNTPVVYLKFAKSSEFESIEFFEEIEELSEDNETVHPSTHEKTSFYLPISKIVDDIIIYSYQCSFYKTFSKPRYYITYSCLKYHLA
jgi:hypothetical protein